MDVRLSFNISIDKRRETPKKGSNRHSGQVGQCPTRKFEVAHHEVRALEALDISWDLCEGCWKASEMLGGVGGRGAERLGEVEVIKGGGPCRGRRRLRLAEETLDPPSVHLVPVEENSSILLKVLLLLLL